MADDSSAQFELLSFVAKGGFGSVYTAFSRVTSEVVAVKVVEIEDESAISMVLDEVNCLQQCDAPNVLKFINAFVEGGSPNEIWIVTELCEGGSLFDFMHSSQPTLDEAQIAASLAGVLQGLDYLHRLEAPLLHRDVKAANCLLTRHGVLRLADFGAAVGVAQAATGDETIGSPHWMAPEVIESNAGYSTAADVWSVGMCVSVLRTHVPAWRPSRKTVAAGAA